jgi:hypothetical protein
MGKKRRKRKAERAELRMRMLIRPKPGTRELEEQIEYWQTRYFASMEGNKKLMDHLGIIEVVLSQLIKEE